MSANFFNAFITNPDKHFGKDQYGNTIYYPWDIGRGYIVPDKIKYEQIREARHNIDKCYSVCFPLGLIIGWFSSEQDVNFLVVLGVSLFIFGIIAYTTNRLIIHPLTKYLTPSPEKRSFKETLIQEGPLPIGHHALTAIILLLFTGDLYLEFESLDPFFIGATLVVLATLALRLVRNKN